MNSITHHAPTQSHAVNSRSCGYFTTSNLLLLYSEKVKVPTVSLIAMFQKLSKIVLFSRKKTVAGSRFKPKKTCCSALMYDIFPFQSKVRAVFDLFPILPDTRIEVETKTFHYWLLIKNIVYIPVSTTQPN